MSKPYPKWTDFSIEDVIFGVSAPYCGYGLYTLDGKFSWPSMDGVSEKELDNWKTWIRSKGYRVPRQYSKKYLFRR